MTDKIEDMADSVGEWRKVKGFENVNAISVIGLDKLASIIGKFTESECRVFVNMFTDFTETTPEGCLLFYQKAYTYLDPDRIDKCYTGTKQVFRKVIEDSMKENNIPHLFKKEEQ